MVLSVPQSLHPPVARQAPVVVLVEGMSDRTALETLAGRLDRRLSDEGISILAMGGATNAARFVDRLGPRGLGVRLAGLYDAAEERHFMRALERAGFGSGLSGPAIEALGFYACHVDLEDELIRALGVASVEQVVEAAGDLGSLRTFQMQPAQQGRDPERQLRRFMGTRSGRKTQYARLLVNALDLGRVPRPLEAVLGQAASLAARLTLTSPAPR
jgi:hypothetical protein